jgi:peptide-methionine (S)-S-oxide reductase
MRNPSSEVATLGGGCFWCLEAVFSHIRGVREVVSGYSGGFMEDPDYASVCSGRSGHAEVIRVEFEPDTVAYEQLLRIFFAIHDPTTLNRQGNDIGTQYRSVIYHHSVIQKETARTLIDELEHQRIWDAPIVTELKPAPPFFEAENYHQHYFSRNPDQGYCQFVIAPKLAKFRKEFLNWSGSV